MRLALTGLFRARWSNAIHEEWIRNLLTKRTDLNREQLEKTRDLMNAYVLDCIVSGYEHLIPSIKLPDLNDCHVVAAAMHSRADLIVTFNLKDFPNESLQLYKLKAKHPDDFIVNLMGLQPALVLNAVAEHRRSLKKPPKTVNEYLDTLEAQRLTQSVAMMRQWSAVI